MIEETDTFGRIQFGFHSDLPITVFCAAPAHRARDDAEQGRSLPDIASLPRGNPFAATPASHPGWKPLPEVTYDEFQSGAGGSASPASTPEACRMRMYWNRSRP